MNIPNIFSGVNVEHSNDAGYTLDINLCDIPKSITLNEKSYELRRVKVRTHCSGSGSGNIVSHVL